MESRKIIKCKDWGQSILKENTSAEYALSGN